MSKTGKTYRYSDSLKHEYGFKKVFTGIKEVKTELKKFIDSYNNKRIHTALGFITPYEAYNAA